MPSLILTLIGPDRPGLVDSLATVIRQQNGNWLESRMSHLAGHFAGIVRVDVAKENADALVHQLEGLEQRGLSVVVRRDESGELAANAAGTVIWMELVGNDRPGIVQEVTHVLSENQVNVEEFQTQWSGAPNSGAPLFRASAELRLPPDRTMDELQKALEAIAIDLMVDIKLAPDAE
jgi:glycine cleavage system regulatory protein